MKNNGKVIWLAWETHRRTLEICDFLGVTPIIYESHLPRLARYLSNIIKTWFTIHTIKPKVLLVQNPSILLAFLSCLLRSTYRYKLIVDSHNAGIYPETYFLRKFSFICKFIQRKADLTITTNKSIAEIVRQNGGRSFVLPDRIPEPKPTITLPLKGRYNAAFICTFKKDEPFREVIEAAKSFNHEVFFYITGDFKKCPRDVINNLSDNVIMMGFLEESDYWNLLSSVDLIMDLTNRENCLVCGAYEAIAVECPMILSNSKTLKGHFSKGAIYTENTRLAIIEAVKRGLAQHGQLKKEISDLKNELIANWSILGNQLRNHIYQH